MNISADLLSGIQLSFVELIGDYGSKIHNLPLTLFGYNLLAVVLFRIMQRPSATLTLVNSNWDGFSNLLTMALGFMMGEKFTPRQYLGCGLITAGLFLIK